MQTVKSRGNIAGLLLFLSLAVIILLLVLLSIYMLPNGIRTGKYINPVVASKVIDGTIYDRNGKVFAISEPVYNESNEIVSYKRSYPLTYHASNIVLEVEKQYGSYISPVPGFNEATTYGNNIYLTLDSDIQFILDIAVQDVYSTQKPEYVTGFIADANTGEYLAISNYPDTNGPDRAFFSQISVGNSTIETKLILKVTDFNNTTTIDPDELESDGNYITADSEESIELLSNNSIYKLLPDSSNPKYVVFIGSKNPQLPEAETEAVDTILKGLIAQTKI